MLRRTSFITGLLLGMAGMAHSPLSFASIGGGYSPAIGRRSSGKGKGRVGARKAYRAPIRTRRAHGKNARRRRRVARLRRG